MNVELQKSEYKRRYIFFTVVTYRRQRFLCDENVRNALGEGIKATQAAHLFIIDAWVNNGQQWGQTRLIYPTNGE